METAIPTGNLHNSNNTMQQQLVPWSSVILTSLRRMSNHEQSKKHKENAAYLKLVMQQDETGESGRESEGVVKEDQSETINSTALDSISSLDEVEVDECPIGNDSKQIPVATRSLGSHSNLADSDGEGDEAGDDATENLDSDDELVDFGAFGKRDRAVCSVMAGNELEDNLVSVYVHVYLRLCMHACVRACMHACRGCVCIKQCLLTTCA